MEIRGAVVALNTKMRQSEAEHRDFVEKHGHIRRPMGVEMNGRIHSVLGSSIYVQAEPGPYNFINAIHDHALNFFGIERLEAEESRDLSDRHPALQWMYEHIDAAPHGAKQDGNGAAWFRFAYDLFTIRDNAQLQLDLREKLLAPKSFQAARYELKVAAICAAAGFDLAFEDERDPKTKHPEFVGTDRFTGTKIAVEAKSRHRRGVLGFVGGLERPPAEKVDIRKLVLEAYAKRPQHPFYVFVDLNLPPANAGDMERWESELRGTLNDLEAEGYLDACPANITFFTNDPSHYVGRDAIGGTADMIWVRCTSARTPQIPHPDSDIERRLLTAHKQRLVPPTGFHETP